MSALDADAERLRVAIDAVVPADDFPSASRAGGLRFWSLITEIERPEWADRVIAVLDLLDRQSGGRFAGLDAGARVAVLDGLVHNHDYVWFAQMVNAGFYADPGNGGNDDAVSWRMLGWSPAPAASWPAEDVWVPDRSPIVVARDQVAARYDAVMVGSGAGGGVAAWALVESCRSVLLVDRGDYPDTSYLARDHLRNARIDSGLDHRTLRSRPRTRAPCFGSGPGPFAALGPALRQQRRHVRRRHPGVWRAGPAVHCGGLQNGQRLWNTRRQCPGRLALRLRRTGAVLHPGRVRDRGLRLR